MSTHDSSTATIVSVEGRRFSIRTLEQSATDGGPDEPCSFVVALETEAATARAMVYDWGNGLTNFWDGLARDWKGWPGERTYASLEGQLTISCTTDALGQVSCVVSLGQLWPPTWRLEAQLTVGGGSHIEQFSLDLARVVG